MRSNFTVVVNNSSWREKIQVSFVAANCLVLLVTLHVGVVANAFVAWAVRNQKSLQTSNNALLVNLAVIDFLRCVIDCPLLLSVVLSARDLGLLFCSAQIASFSLICCVQLLTLACISAERYQAVARPFKSAERRKRIAVLIPLTWLLPISISVVCVIFAKDSPVYVKCRGLRMETLDHYDTFGFYILTPVWCVCLVIITGFYGRIFLLVRAHGRKIFDKGSFPPPKKEDKRQKEKDTKTIFKSENPQVTDADHLKPSCGDLHSKSEELKAPVNDSDVNKTEKHRKTFKYELENEALKVLESSVEQNDDLDTSAESSASHNEVGAKSENQHPNTDEDVSEGSTNGESSVETKVHQDVAPDSSQSSVNEETCDEEFQNHHDITSKTSPPTTNEEFGAVDMDISEGSASKEGVEESNVHQDVDLESSQSSAYGERGEEDAEIHQLTFPHSAKEKDVTFRSGSPQDMNPETLTSEKVEVSEEQPVPQETAGEGCPSSTEGAAAVVAVVEEEVAGAVCMMPSLAQRERGNAKKESKLAKRSGYIIFTFLIFWIPLITTVLLNHFYYRSGNLTVEVFRELEILTVSLVCLTSVTNPIIYAAVNPQFRTEFHNLKSKWKAFFTRS